MIRSTISLIQDHQVEAESYLCWKLTSWTKNLGPSELWTKWTLIPNNLKRELFGRCSIYIEPYKSVGSKIHRTSKFQVESVWQSFTHKVQKNKESSHRRYSKSQLRISPFLTSPKHRGRQGNFTHVLIYANSSLAEQTIPTAHEIFAPRQIAYQLFEETWKKSYFESINGQFPTWNWTYHSNYGIVSLFLSFLLFAIAVP